MSRCVTCGTSRRELNYDRTGDLLCLRCYLPRYPNEVLTDEEIAKGLPIERLRTRRGQRVRPESLLRVAATLADRGLRPVIDHGAELIRADCLKCRSGESDPVGLYRPLEVIPRDAGTEARCDICGGPGNA